MAKTIDELMQEHVPAAYAEYENLLKLARDFGAEAVRQKLLNKQNLVSPEQMLGLIQRNVNKMSNDISSKVFNAVKLQLEQRHTPRADSPRAQNILQNDSNPTLSKQARLEQAPWLKNVDFAADPKVRDAQIAQVIANNLNNPNVFKELTTQFADAKAEQKLVNKLKQQNKMPAPSPKRKIEPRP